MDGIDPQIASIANELFGLAGLAATPTDISPIKRDGNNQLFVISTQHQRFILKQYFQNPADLRNRLNTEFEFLQLASRKAPRQVPKPYAKSDHQFAALYELIDGATITSSAALTENHILQAGQFIACLNDDAEPANMTSLRAASEACFSVAEHIERIDFRLVELEDTQPLHVDDLEFGRLLSLILSRWQEIKADLIHRCSANRQFALYEKLTAPQRVLSPSDFGFHNVLVRQDSSVAFIDFEYAGWDDPAKLVGDFFAQVALPVDLKYFDLFVDAAFRSRPDYEMIYARAEALLSLYKIKWCCIVLNIYLPKHLARRQFANPTLNVSEIKQQQLLKAKQLLEEAIL